MRFLQFIVIAATALSCGGGSLNGSGTGGAAGTSAGGSGGASAGSSGGGNVTGGAGGSVIGGTSGTTGLPACNLAAPLMILGSISGDTGQLTAPTTASVTVTDIVQDGPTTYVDLASTTDSRHFTWRMSIPNLPSDLINFGFAFDLTVDARDERIAFGMYLSQTVVLAREGLPIAFTATLFGLNPVLPALGAWGITVEDMGMLCDNTSVPICGWRLHAARVTYGGQPETVVPNQTATILNLSFSVSHFESPFSNGGGCDAASVTTMAGFRRY